LNATTNLEAGITTTKLWDKKEKSGKLAMAFPKVSEFNQENYREDEQL